MGSPESSAVPPGWRENPTAWSKRARLAALAFAGLCVATYLTLYQVDVLGSVVDPLFGHGSREVLDLTSPVPDAAFGVVAYALELVLCFVGPTDRWRSKPWTVLVLGAVIVAGAITSLALIAIQPIVVGTWCSLCLVSAGLSLTIFALGVDEPRAALEHLRGVRRDGGDVRGAILGRQPSAGAAGS
jgi:vitamin K epoxide reductase family protein